MGGTKKSKRARSSSASSVEIQNYKESKGHKRRKHSVSVNESDSDAPYKNDRQVQKKVDKQRKNTQKYDGYSSGSSRNSSNEKSISGRKHKKEKGDRFENTSEKTVLINQEDERSRSRYNRDRHKNRHRSVSTESFVDSRKSYKDSGDRKKVESRLKFSKSSQDYKAEAKYSSSKSDKDHKSSKAGSDFDNEASDFDNDFDKSYKDSGDRKKVESRSKFSKSSQNYKAEAKYSSSKSDKDHKSSKAGSDFDNEADRNYKRKKSHDVHDDLLRKSKSSEDKHYNDGHNKKPSRKNRYSSDDSENDTSYKNSERSHNRKMNEYIERKENQKTHYGKHRKGRRSAFEDDRLRTDREVSSDIDRRMGPDNDSNFNSQQFESSEKYGRYWSNKTDMERNSTENRSKNPQNKNQAEHKVGPRYYNVSVDGAKNKENDQGIKPSEIEDKTEKNENKSSTEVKVDTVTPAQKKTVDLLTSRTGGAYIPPAKLRMMQANITDKSSAAYQRIAWEALKKSIQGHVNKVNISNIRTIVKELQKENIVRGRGLLCRSIIQAQAASPTFTHVYAAFVCAINSKFPNIGELLLKRLVVQFRRGFKRNDKTICISAANFIAHLVNQQVAHEILALQILTLLIENPTDDSVEVAISFLKECGMKLTEVSNKGISAIFDMLRNILHEGSLDKRVQYMIEVMFQVRKDDFKAHPALLEELDIVPEENKIMHIVTLEDNNEPQDILNVFKFDPEYEANEEKYKSLIDEDSSDESGDSDGSEGSSEEGSDEDEEENNKGDVIVDRTETNLVILRRTIYLTIQSSLDFEECAHKLLRMQLKPGQEIEICHMFLDCCAEQRTYEKFFGLLAQRFCQINRSYIGPFEETFRDTYATVHRVDTDKLRNIAKLFAHLLYTDAISWEVLSTIRLNEDDTTSSSRIFIKILFLELSEYMGLAKLNQRVKDPTLQTALEGLFPRDNPKNTRFAINFFTSIGLGGLTDELREHLKAQPKANAAVPQLVEALSVSSESSSSESSSSSSSSSESSSEESSSSDTSSDSEDSSTNKKKTTKKKKPVQKNSKKSSEKKRGSDKKKVKPSKQKKKKNR